MKLVEFLALHGLERQVRLLVRDGILTQSELEATPDERLAALNLAPRELLILRKAMGRKIQEPLPPPAPKPKQQPKPESIPVPSREKASRPLVRIGNLKAFLLGLCGLLMLGLVVLAVFFIYPKLHYDSEKAFSWPWQKENPSAPGPVAAKEPERHPSPEKSPSFSGFMSRYQEALQQQDPSKIAAFFTAACPIVYYEKTISLAELLALLEKDRLNEPVLIRSVEDMGVIEPSPSSGPAITWNRFLLRYETKKGKFEKKIRVGVMRNASGEFTIFSESNDGDPLQTDAPAAAGEGEGVRGAPYAPVAWRDPGFLSPGRVQQLELVFHGCKPTKRWSLPQVSELQILGQPRMSQTFRQGRTDLNLLFSIRILNSGEVRIPAFEITTDQGVVEVPGLTLNTPLPVPEQDSTAKKSMGRGLPVQRKSKDRQEVAEMKDFYNPADVFPEGKIGLRLVGNFIVLRFSNGGNYLSADESRGEKDTMRRFVPENGNLPLGARYTFTREQPLVISSVSLLGQYGVLVPEGIRPDRF